MAVVFFLFAALTAIFTGYVVYDLSRDGSYGAPIIMGVVGLGLTIGFVLAGLEASSGDTTLAIQYR